MAAVLIKARPGVYGRQATEQERKLLKQFAEDYVASTSTRRATDVAVLKKLTSDMLTRTQIGKASGGVLSPAPASNKSHSGRNAKVHTGAGSPQRTSAPVKAKKTAGKSAIVAVVKPSRKR